MSNVVIFDLETAGLDWRTDDILSIAATCNGETFDSYVRNTRPINPAASAINGIYEFTVADAEPWAVVGPRFLRWVFDQAGPNPVLVAYNGFRFDVPFLKKKFTALPAEAFPAFQSIQVSFRTARGPVSFSKKLSRRRTPTWRPAGASTGARRRAER